MQGVPSAFSSGASSAKPEFLENLFAAFDAMPQKLDDIQQLTEPGPPLYVACENVPRNLVLLDTPDFDVGDRLAFANRGAAEPVLEACDVLLYIFTNSNYNNLGNTTFIRDVLTGVGCRKAALIYRCSRVFSEEDVREHTQTVQNNVYGEDGDKWIVGTFRVNEDDAVANGSTFMRIDPLPGGQDLHDTLGGLDIAATRSQLLAEAMQGVTRDAQQTQQAASLTRDEILLYRDAVRVATSWAAIKTLEAFPKEKLLKRFLEIWEETQPKHLKFLKRTGSVVAFPLKGTISTARKVRNAMWKDKAPAPVTHASPEELSRKNLFDAVNELRNKILGDELAVTMQKTDPDGKRMLDLANQILGQSGSAALPACEPLDAGNVNMRIARPDALKNSTAQHGPWETQLHNLAAESEQWSTVSTAFDEELTRIAQDFRQNMGKLAIARETLTASLPSIATAAALSYVVITWDPVVGSGIYAHLTAMFGMNDLFALLSIPAATGLNAAHRKNLQLILTPIYEAWFKEKAETVRESIERHVAREMLDAADQVLSQTQKPLTELNTALETIRNGETQ